MIQQINVAVVKMMHEGKTPEQVNTHIDPIIRAQPKKDLEVATRTYFPWAKKVGRGDLIDK